MKRASKTPIADGWESFRKGVIHPKAPPDQLSEMRKAFFAGAIHTFYSLLSKVDEGEEITQKDLELLDNYQKEIEKYGERLIKIAETYRK
jgi:hypothetical protein